MPHGRTGLAGRSQGITEGGEKLTGAGIKGRNLIQGAILTPGDGGVNGKSLPGGVFSPHASACHPRRGAFGKPLWGAEQEWSPGTTTLP